MKYLLDTSTCIAVLQNHPKALQRMAAVAPADCAISSIAAYELYTGVEKCANPSKERPRVDLFLNALPILSFESRAAKEAARVRAFLESTGQPIGPYDVLLAGHALASLLTLVTSNTNEFGRIPGLNLEDWQT